MYVDLYQENKWWGFIFSTNYESCNKQGTVPSNICSEAIQSPILENKEVSDVNIVVVQGFCLMQGKRAHREHNGCAELRRQKETLKLTGQSSRSKGTPMKDIQEYAWMSPWSVANYRSTCAQGKTPQAEHRTTMMGP